MTIVPLLLAMLAAPEPDVSLFSCVEVTLSDRSRITSARTAVSSGNRKSDRRALAFLRSLDLSRVHDVRYVPASGQITEKPIPASPGTGFVVVEHYDKDSFGIDYSGRLLAACPAMPVAGAPLQPKS